MRNGFVSGSLSVALSALIAAILFLSMPWDADRDRNVQNADKTTSVEPSDAPIADEQKASAVAGVESITLPPPPVLHQPDQEKPPLTNVESPNNQAVSATVIEPLQPTAPESQQSQLEAIEPLRPSSPADTLPEKVEAEPLQPSAMDEFETSTEIVPDAELSLEPAPISEGTSRSGAASPPDAAIVAEGRVLLRILEHGSGPSIEIAWPVDPGKRRQLFRRFGSCFGMKIALMDEDGSLFIAKGIRGQSWDIDLDRHSGFVRQTTGRITAGEERQVRNIRAFHGGLGRTASVRVFPRRMDAILLGGLRQLIGNRYGKVGSISASYRVNGDQVLVEAIEADGERIPGHVKLSGAAKSSCRYQGVT